MSNLLKYGTTVSKSERVIDYNDIIKDKLKTITELSNKKRMDPDGFVKGLNAEVVEALISDTDDTDANDSQDDSAATAEQKEAATEHATTQASAIIEEAKQQAQKVLDEAMQQAESIKEQAKTDGYNDGISAANDEIASKQSELEKAYQAKEKQLVQEYEHKKSQIEPELVEVITEVFKRVTNTVAEDNKDIILHLIKNVISNTENTSEFNIRTSMEDYKFLINNQGKIFVDMSKEIQINIIEDASLQQNQCIIETDTGVFNCSLDIELNNLISDLKLLSCMN